MMDQDFSDLHQASELEEKIQDLIAQVSSLKAELLQAQKEKGDLVQKIIDKDKEIHNIKAVAEKLLNKAQAEIDRLKGEMLLQKDAEISSLEWEVIQAQIQTMRAKMERDEILEKKETEIQNIRAAAEAKQREALSEIEVAKAKMVRLRKSKDAALSHRSEAAGLGPEGGRRFNAANQWQGNRDPRHVPVETGDRQEGAENVKLADQSE